MDELLILNEDNLSSKNYGIYYTVNDRFYVIYTNMDKDDKNYVIMHIAKVLKEVNNTPDGIVPTGKYIGIDISDASEWENSIVNINEVIASKQKNTPASVTFLPVTEINEINIKGSRTFKLREDVVDSIIANVKSLEVKNDVIEEVPAEITPVDLPVEPAIESVQTTEDVLPSYDSVQDDALPIPTIAPNPFEENAEPVIPEPIIPEEKPVNPYDIIKQQRDEEMVSILATDDMKDIEVTPTIPINELENQKVDNEIAPVMPANEDALPVQDTVESAQQENKVELPAEESTNNNSFVDSIVADVSNMLDDSTSAADKVENSIENADYEKLYNDALEKTVELEKELAELHSKLNNIKNIVE